MLTRLDWLKKLAQCLAGILLVLLGVAMITIFIVNFLVILRMDHAPGWMYSQVFFNGVFSCWSILIIVYGVHLCGAPWRKD